MPLSSAKKVAKSLPPVVVIASTGRVVGSAQDQRITALDRVWRQISDHPHNGGGGPAWNPTKHGFHTYLGELLSWLFNAK